MPGSLGDRAGRVAPRLAPGRGGGVSPPCHESNAAQPRPRRGPSGLSGVGVLAPQSGVLRCGSWHRKTSSYGKWNRIDYLTDMVNRARALRLRVPGRNLAMLKNMFCIGRTTRIQSSLGTMADEDDEERFLAVLPLLDQSIHFGI